MTDAYLSSKGPLLEYELPDYRYYPANLLPHGTRDWSRVRFLQTCARLRIPLERWPDFGKLALPATVKVAKPPPPFKPPSFDPLRGGAETWRRKANEAFRQYCTGFLDEISRDITGWLKDGFLIRIPQPKGRAPQSLRFEWAAKRFCLEQRYKEMATSEYNDALIRQAVRRIFLEVQINGVTKRGDRNRHTTSP